jgi:hypothetical protein
MLSDHIVASDSAIIRIGNFINLTGVAAEIDGYNEFRKKYFGIIEGFYKRYNISLSRLVLKTEDILKLVPSYDIQEAHIELTEELLKIKNIKRINVTNTILLADSVITWKGKITGLEFVNKILQQYYPVVPIWRYYFKYRNFPNYAKHAVLDGIQGKITKAWNFVGKTADIVNVVPHGDQTHPCISLCDLICGYIKNTVYHIDANEILNQLKDKTPAYVYSEFVGDNEIEYLRTEYPHSLKVERNFPHPVFIIHKSESIDNKIVKDTDFFQLLLRFAELRGGAVSFEDLVNQQSALQKGDYLICLDNKGYEKMKYVEILNPYREIKVLNVEETYKLMKNRERTTLETISESE